MIKQVGDIKLMVAIDVSHADFEEQVVKASFLQPVVIDFWAPWCGPCNSLKPILEKLAGEYGGKFLLAKVNSDENQELSTQYGVRSIPSVKAMVNGKVVDEFSGALPEGEVRTWLDKIMPSLNLSPVDVMRKAARLCAEAGDLAGALQKLAGAVALEPANEWVRVDAAEIMLVQGETDESRRLLDSLKTPEVVDDARVLKLRAHIKLTQMIAAGDDEASLTAVVTANPNDVEARLKLATGLVAMQRYAEGMDQLLEIVQRDRKFQDDIGRKTLLEVLNLLGGQGELVTEYRRKLSSVMN